jgi:hypothetical protein
VTDATGGQRLPSGSCSGTHSRSGSRERPQPTSEDIPCSNRQGRSWAEIAGFDGQPETLHHG